jgi:hypothetical protein
MRSRNLPALAGPEPVKVRPATHVLPQPTRADRRSDLLFLFLTVGPWIVLAWLLWPRR